MSVESFLDLTTLERWPVQPLIPGDIPVAGQFNPIPVAGVLNQIPVAGEFNPMQVVDVTPPIHILWRQPLVNKFYLS